MSKHVDHLNRVFLELRDRYGSNDPAVLEVKKELDACTDQELQHRERLLPFGERRSATREAHYWSVKPRNVSQPASRHDIVGKSRRIEGMASQ